ncbi:hypothetical protein RUND412_002578 [Rhizina undulata]
MVSSIRSAPPVFPSSSYSSGASTSSHSHIEAEFSSEHQHQHQSHHHSAAAGVAPVPEAFVQIQEEQITQTTHDYDLEGGHGQHVHLTSVEEHVITENHSEFDANHSSLPLRSHTTRIEEHHHHHHHDRPEHTEVHVEEKHKHYQHHHEDDLSSLSSKSVDSHPHKLPSFLHHQHKDKHDHLEHEHTQHHHTPSEVLHTVAHTVAEHLPHHKDKYSDLHNHTSHSHVGEFESEIVSSHNTHSRNNKIVEEVFVDRSTFVAPVHEQHSHSQATFVDDFAPSVVEETYVYKEEHKRPLLSALASTATTKMAKFDNYTTGQTVAELEAVDYALSTHQKVYESGKSHISSAHAQNKNTFTIPCHHIRIGDLVILQHRPCQIIRITTSAQTGQHRYLGVDLFTKQLHEEPCVVSHPSPSVVLHSLLGPVFKQYRLVDIRDDGKLVAMTETGEIKQGLRVVDQGHLWGKLKEAFGHGSGSVRVLVISDHGKELAVDYKIVHLAHKL